ncbi:hypothetical protein [Alcaligenes sp. Marseille-Q7550]
MVARPFQNFIQACIPKNPELALERKDLEPCPLGRMGNLQFNVEQGGTARAGRISTLLSDICHSLAHFLNEFGFTSICEPSEERSQRHAVVQARKNSRRLGDLLGSLTARADDAQACSRIAVKLIKLCDPLRGDLGRMMGGQKSLTFYLSELSDSDLIAMHNGVSGCPLARAAMLKEISRVSAWKGEQLPEVLNQIAEALRDQFIQRVVQEPFGQIVRQLSGRSVDGCELREPLIRLAKGLDQFEASRRATAMGKGGDPLDGYLRFLPEGQLELLLTHCLSGRLNTVQQTLSRTDNDSESQAAAMLERIGNSLEREWRARARPGPANSPGHADHAEMQFKASKRLYDLSAWVGGTMRTQGSLPEGLYEKVRSQVDAAMALFRDARNNPIGSLNRASLMRLGDSTLWYLHRASNLRSLGLILDQDALNDVALSRLETHIQQFPERNLAENAGSAALLAAWEAPRQDVIRKLVSMIDEGPKKQQAEAMLARIQS